MFAIEAEMSTSIVLRTSLFTVSKCHGQTLDLQKVSKPFKI